MRRPKIKTTLCAIIIALGGVFALFAAFALDRLSVINANVIEIATDALPTVEVVKDLQVQVGEMRTAYRSHILRSDAEGKTAAGKGVDAAIAAIKADTAQYRQLGPNPQESRLLDVYEKAVAEYVSAGKDVLELSGAGKSEDANRILRETMSKSSEAARSAVDGMLKQAADSTDEAFSSAQQAYNWTFQVTLGLGAALAARSWRRFGSPSAE